MSSSVSNFSSNQSLCKNYGQYSYRGAISKHIPLNDFKSQTDRINRDKRIYTQGISSISKSRDPVFYTRNGVPNTSNLPSGVKYTRDKSKFILTTNWGKTRTRGKKAHANSIPLETFTRRRPVYTPGGLSRYLSLPTLQLDKETFLPEPDNGNLNSSRCIKNDPFNTNIAVGLGTNPHQIEFRTNSRRNIVVTTQVKSNRRKYVKKIAPLYLPPLLRQAYPTTTPDDNDPVYCWDQSPRAIESPSSLTRRTIQELSSYNVPKRNTGLHVLTMGSMKSERTGRDKWLDQAVLGDPYIRGMFSKYTDNDLTKSMGSLMDDISCPPPTASDYH